MSCVARCWLVLAAVAGCSSPSLELDQLDDAMFAAQCLRAVRCGLETSVEACRAYAVTPPPSSFPAARAAGHLEFDGDEARRCEDALAARPCDVTSRDARIVPDACKRVFAGRVADGDPCAFDEECTSGRCDQGVCPEGVCCIGACGETRTGGAPGDACDRSSECTDGFCDGDHTCHALAGNNASCQRDEECAYGLACVSPSPSLPGECKALPRLGEPCPYQRCTEIGTVCAANGLCVAVGLPGAPCTIAQDCSPYLLCDATQHVCIERPVLGMPCDAYCAGDAYCDFSTGGQATCTTLMPNGTPCDDSGTCASHNCKPGPVFDACADYPICP